MLEKGCRYRVQFALFGRRLHDKLGDFVRICRAEMQKRWRGNRWLREVRRLIDWWYGRTELGNFVRKEGGKLFSNRRDGREVW